MYRLYFEFQAALSANVFYCITADQTLSLPFVARWSCSCHFIFHSNIQNNQSRNLLNYILHAPHKSQLEQIMLEKSASLHRNFTLCCHPSYPTSLSPPPTAVNFPATTQVTKCTPASLFLLQKNRMFFSCVMSFRSKKRKNSDSSSPRPTTRLVNFPTK
jgi:hypothetical protein